MKPYANESEVVQIGDLTIENRLGRISLYGEIDITRDKQGLKAAQELKAVIDASLKVLEADLSKGELPDAVTLEKTVSVDNPFTCSLSNSKL